ncbi:MAG TPA: hypothetical protein VFU93_06145 [Acidimicrobiales bacterium]|nr:hypothetical protein [Acidimicrobiales bacterium]
MIETEAWGSELASWTPLVVLLVVFAVIVAALLVRGRGGLLERIPEALERRTGIPGWAAAAMGTSLYGLLIAGQGFYSDVAWHIALGRDKALFTAPHTSIVVGLGFIFVASAIGILCATVQRVETDVVIGGMRVPWSMLPLAALGAGALAGFPLDELWHREYGVDVTMWSPTHMLMILGASFSGMASWLVLADAGVSPRDSRWARGVHVVAAWLTIMGLTSAQGEFDFGVPQFQQMFHPILVTIAGAFALVAIRLVHGRGWALAIVLGSLVFDQIPLFGDGEPVPTRDGGLYVVSALVVELVAWLAGTDRRVRFAVLSGAGVATIGLGAEWIWNQGAHQPWRSSLLPDAIWLCLLAGIGAAVVGAAFGRAVGRERAGRLPAAVVVAGALAVVVALALPMPRRVGDVSASIDVEPARAGQVSVRVVLDPHDAAEDARWFQAMSWQGGGLVIREMEEVGPGEFVSDGPLPVTGRGKALVRLHRGGELMAVPVFLPSDPEIDESEIPAEDRVARFQSETDFLLRETTEGAGGLAIAIYALLAVVAGVWIGAFVLAARRTGADAPDAPVPSLT